MPNVKFRASGRTLTSHAGLSIIGQCLETAGVDSIDGRFLTTLGMRTSDVVKSYLRLLCLGMTGELSPVRHPAKGRRLRTVLQELVHRAALVIHMARELILDFGQDIGRMTVLKTLRSRLRHPRGSPC